MATLNLAYFGVEFAVATAIGSVSLFADSVDFLEDTAVNLLIVLALGWTVRARARVGMLLAGILLVPAAALLWAVWEKLQMPVPPDPAVLSATGMGALLVNLFCAWLLVRHRHHGGSLTRAAFLSARNERCPRQHRDHGGRRIDGAEPFGVARRRCRTGYRGR